jgi:ubiquinone biosynthesis protein
MTAAGKLGLLAPAAHVGSGPARARRLLQRLGPTFIKIGQFLALRPDLIPQDYATEFLRLLDDVAPFAWHQARAILDQELGDLSAAFEYVNPRPVAAGSLAQVHLARRWDGTPVAIKILRPGIAQRIQTDLRRCRALAHVLRAAGVEFPLSPGALVEELGAWLLREIDLRNELANLQKLRDLAGDSAIQIIPRAWPELSTARVLTLEQVRGIPFTEIISVLDQGGEAALRQHDWEIDPDALARNLMQATLDQMFRYRFFHADLHPGNLMALPDSTIGYVDFGLCEAMDPAIASEQGRYLAALNEGDVARMSRALLELLIPGPEADAEQFRNDFAEESRRWQEAAHSEEHIGRDRETRSATGHWLVGAMRAARRNHFTLPRGLLAAYRALLTAETVAQQLSARSQLRLVGRRFFTRMQTEDALRRLTSDSLRTSLPELVQLLQDAPARLNDMLTDLSAGQTKLKAEWSEDGRARRSADRRTRLLALAIVSVGLAFLFGSAGAEQAIGPIARSVFGILLGVVYLLIIRQWLRLR